MIYLDLATDKIEVVTDTSGTVDCVASWVEAASATLSVSASGKKTAAITTAATPADVSGSPAGSATRTLKQLTCRNKDGSAIIGVTVRLNANSTIYEIHKAVLSPGEMLQYIEGVGFFKIGNSSPNRLLSGMEGDDTQRIFGSRLTEGSTFLTISGTAYFVYVGRAAQDLTVKFVEYHETTAGTGTDTKELGLYSTPAAPNKSAQTLTKLAATGTVDTSTGTGMKRNTASFAQAVPAGTHLWAAYRGALATTQNTMVGLANDQSQGRVLVTTGGGALTGVTSASGLLVALSAATIAPCLRVLLD